MRQVTLNVVEEELTEMEDSESILDLEDVGKIYGLGGNLLSEPSQRNSEASSNQIEERWSLEIEQIRQLECAGNKKQILEQFKTQLSSRSRNESKQDSPSPVKQSHEQSVMIENEHLL